MALAALAVTTTAASVYSEIKSANAQEKAIFAQLAQSETEIDRAETAEINDRTRAMRKEQARLKVAAGEAGLQLGGSVEMLLKDSLMQSGLSQERTHMNANAQRHNVRAEANSMLSRIQKPTALGAGLQIANAGVSGWMSGKSLQISRDAMAASAGAAAGGGR